jgi:hypothetical protein
MRSSEFVKDAKLAENATGGATGSAAVATTPGAKSSEAGSLFGGTYQQRNNPFRKKGKKK